MIELAPNIYYIPGENRSRFPYCACLYVKGKKMRVLIDAGMGKENLMPVKPLGIDLILLTHCHIDHHLTRKEIPHVPIWCHEKEGSYIVNKETYFSSTGLGRSGVDLSSFFGPMCGVFDIEISHKLVDGEKIDLGGLTLIAIHTPGHTPGHLSFYIPEHELLFSGDVDLTSFGPFYGHDFADIDDFIQSIDRLRHLDAKIVATSHAGPFENTISKHLDTYEKIIYGREEKVLKLLSRPQTLESLKGRHIIYNTYPNDFILAEWFECVHIEKHLVRLTNLGSIRKDSNGWMRC